MLIRNESTKFRKLCVEFVNLTFKRQPLKMVKHSQTIRRLLPTNYLSVFDHFVGFVLIRLKLKYMNDVGLSSCIMEIKVLEN